MIYIHTYSIWDDKLTRVGSYWYVIIRSIPATYYEKLSFLELFQNKWCHSTHLKLNNRSDESSVYHAAAVRVITKDTSGTLTQSYQSLYELRVSQEHTVAQRLE